MYEEDEAYMTDEVPATPSSMPGKAGDSPEPPVVTSTPSPGGVRTTNPSSAPAPARLAVDESFLKEAPSPSKKPAEGLEIKIGELMRVVVERGCSDLHLTAGTPPVIRLHGDLQRLDEYPRLDPVTIRSMVYSILTQRQREKFEDNLELDLSHTLPGHGRFRVNVYLQRDSVGAAFRLIPPQIKTLQELDLPPQMEQFAHYPRGLVLITGPTGSGKSTTLAALIDIINNERQLHIMTIEDPIEFLHRHKLSVVNQREVGTDTKGFAEALRHVLRQDPDVILVGEMRDLETISTAITAAETGHLVFATLHTQDAPQTIDRVIDVFPPHQQQQVRVQFAASIQAIATQQLLPTKEGNDRIPAVEVMVATPAIRNLIREGKTHQIYSAMQAGGRYGMQTTDQALAELVKRGKITFDLALDRCHDVQEFTRLAGR
jgi:twitching motility protein PilT